MAVRRIALTSALAALACSGNALPLADSGPLDPTDAGADATTETAAEPAPDAGRGDAGGGDEKAVDDVAPDLAADLAADVPADEPADLAPDAAPDLPADKPITEGGPKDIPLDIVFPGYLFDDERPISFPSGGVAFAIGDVTGDGRNDVVMTTGDTGGMPNVVAVFAQTPAGELHDPVSYPTGTAWPDHHSKAVAIADVTGDGLADVIVDVDAAVGVFAQTGEGKLAAIARTASSSADGSSNPYVVEVGKLDGDDSWDVASLAWSPDPGVEVFLQGAGGKLGAPTPYAAPHTGDPDLAIGDVTGDGRDDIVVTKSWSTIDNIVVLAQKSSGGFADAVVYDGTDKDIGGPNSVAVGDVTGDGRSDVVVSFHGSTAHVAVIPQLADGTLGTPIPYPSYMIPEDVLVADVNGDGKGDVLVLHQGWSNFGVYLQNAAGTLDKEDLYPFGTLGGAAPDRFTVGDINGDGKPDVVGGYPYGMVVRLHR